MNAFLASQIHKWALRRIPGLLRTLLHTVLDRVLYLVKPFPAPMAKLEAHVLVAHGRGIDVETVVCCGQQSRMATGIVNASVLRDGPAIFHRRLTGSVERGFHGAFAPC